ncbi:hypothetical protein CKA55_12440 [Arcobacter suis]|uniref:Uncharacterized protein n=1 Tax=Arcobacter suis CECT 7833 TaxID=663365 RepID=A0AAD0WQ48_9BACT|nr:hypothetical protein [Arcobacter suis]AXX89369.1 hypothetical protein ASUIS_0878 [Arcobacter suis CECT 7833]RWS45495.1 hypothetical protein CKA55_12440 [Arcobacter suis]
MIQVLDITSIEEIERLREAILNNEDYKLGKVKPIKHIIKLDGGRFNHYNINYITSDIAKIILSHQKNFEKLLNELESKFEIAFSEQERVLRFQLKHGCLEIFSDIFSKETIMSMDSKHKMWTLITIASLVVGGFSANEYINHLNEQIQSHEKIKMKELENLDNQNERNDRNNEREATKQYFDRLHEVNKVLLQNKTIQDSINTPKKETLAILKDNEVYKTVDHKTLTKNDISKFDYIAPNLQDIEEEVTEIYTLEYYNFVRDGKMFKIVGISQPANSSILTPQERMKLIKKADSKEQVKLRLKIIKDRVTKKTKDAYILEYIEN